MKTIFENVLPPVSKLLRIVWKVTKGFFLAYAVIFSVAATAALAWGAIVISKPILAVKKLQTSNPHETLYMRLQKKELRKENKSDSLAHDFVPLDSISEYLIHAVLAAEDDGFYMHPGIDLQAIARAIDYNDKKNRHAHGASTITQQMAKNLFAGGEKSFKRKYRELVYSLLMEFFLGKDRILELYLNYAQWGENIFGAGAAARHYYSRSPAELTFSQSTRLAAVLAMPEKLSPHYTQSSFLQKRLRVIANNLYLRGKIGDQGFTAIAGADILPPGAEPDSALTDSTAAAEKQIPENHAADSLKEENAPAPDSTTLSQTQ